jgi:hypothetical protein
MTTHPSASRPSFSSRLVREVRAYPVGYGVLAVFLVAGPCVTHFMFPDAPTGAGFVGGLVFGAYATLCAVPEKFFE